MKARPAVDERGELRGRQPHDAVADRRPAKRPFLKALPIQNQARPVPGQDLQPVRPFRAEDENRPGERIALKLFFRQPRQAVGAASEVDRLRRHQNPNARRNRDHVAAFTARSTFVSVATSIPGLTRTTAAPSAISIVAHGIAQEAAADGAGHHLRETHAARGGRSASAADSSSLRIAPPAEQLLRRQSMSPSDCRDFVPALIALCKNLRLLLRRPNAPPSGPGENLKPTNRLPLRAGLGRY